MVYRHSAPWLRRMPLTRMNRDSEADSDPSTKTINSPGTNLSRLRVGSSVALNASFTRNLVIATSMLLLLRCPFSKGPNPPGCLWALIQRRADSADRCDGPAVLSSYVEGIPSRA